MKVNDFRATKMSKKIKVSIFSLKDAIVSLQLTYVRKRQHFQLKAKKSRAEVILHTYATREWHIQLMPSLVILKNGSSSLKIFFWFTHNASSFCLGEEMRIWSPASVFRGCETNCWHATFKWSWFPSFKEIRDEIAFKLHKVMY